MLDENEEREFKNGRVKIERKTMMVKRKGFWKWEGGDKRVEKFLDTVEKVVGWERKIC